MSTPLQAVIDHWTAGRHDDLIDLLPLLEAGSDAISNAMRQTILALWQQAPAEAALKAAEAPSGADGEGALLLGLLTVLLFAREGRVSSATALMRRLDDRCRAAAVEWQAFAEAVRGMIAAAKERPADHLAHLVKALALLPAGHPHAHSHAYALAVMAAQGGVLAQYQQVQAILQELPANRCRCRPWPEVTFIDACERGDWASARIHGPAVAYDVARLPDLHPVQRSILEQRLELLAAVSARDRQGPSTTKASGRVDPLLASLLALKAGDGPAALTWARQDHEALTRGPDLLGAALIRAELALRHGEAALRLLEIRRRQSCTGLLEEVFQAQALWISGDHRGAAAALRAAESAAERDLAQGRLALEWDLAIGLSRSELAALVRLAAHKPTKAVNHGDQRSSTPAAILVGSGPTMSALRDNLLRLGSARGPVLLHGETGTGKDLAARLIHQASSRRDQPFVAINCAAISESLLESELFGHERGAFSGAVLAHAGCFEQAGEGTLFLDEVGELAPRLQAALLRVLENGDFRRVGGERNRRSACRIVVATNRELSAEVAAGRFRQDLFYRLSVFDVRLPPLREHLEDLEEIALHLLREDSPRPAEVSLSHDLLVALARRPWPGNVRELRHVLERMRLFASERGAYRLADLTADAPAPLFQAHPHAVPAAHGADQRRKRLQQLLAQRGTLRRMEVMHLFGISQQTATADLRALVAAGSARKVEPSRAPRSHYWEAVAI